MDLLGVNKAKRRIAKQVGADPYTTNPVLAKQLDDLARAAFAGGVSLDVALAVSTAGVATAISATATVSNLVWDKSPEDIRTINERKLAAMGVGADTVRAFVTNRWLTPTLSVPFVEHLAQMPAAKGRAAVVALASTVASEGEARFMVNAVSMARQISTRARPRRRARPGRSNHGGSHARRSSDGARTRGLCRLDRAGEGVCASERT